MLKPPFFPGRLRENDCLLVTTGKSGNTLRTSCRLINNFHNPAAHLEAPPYHFRPRLFDVNAVCCEQSSLRVSVNDAFVVLWLIMSSKL